MRKLVAIFLFYYISFEQLTSPVAEVAKICGTLLFAQTAKLNLTLAGFLQNTLLRAVVVDDDFDKDMQLPFKNYADRIQPDDKYYSAANKITPLQATPVFHRRNFSPYKQVVASFYN